jgi:hypothetical protein
MMLRSSITKVLSSTSLAACGFACALLAAACGGGSTSSSGTCGLAVYENDATCQAWLDKSCCAQQKACAADAACAQLVACANACPAPRTATCLDACGTNASAAAQAEAKAIITCEQASSPPANCRWP